MNAFPTIRRSLILPLFAVGMLLCAGPAVGVVIEAGDETPDEMVGVGVEENLGVQLPLDLAFRNEEGEAVTLGSYMNGEKPVLLLLNYSNCPMLCGQQLNDLVRALNDPGMENFSIGREFDIVSVSIDPREQPERAKLTHKRYSEQYDRPGTSHGWHFLVGNDENIHKLADLVGYRYNFVESTGEFAHPATLMIVTPEGVVSRYINGLGYEAKTLRLSMVEAADGKVGSTVDQILLTCFVYDHTKGKYAPQAVGIMKLGAAATVLVLGLALAPYWLHRRRSTKSTESDSTDSTDTQETITA
ncbi:SCO family protein [Aeoliella mucimassa]|uniref:Thioredoxin domain-containing protein n=1 Tax=Aeoliella mucimassa TaxID=2527972 RepID=A0A518AGX8_9BACT|nr:SCO family protein [Aeoliella mucimassa]QDU53990.1 hypothetical protein Pan181_01700 [Aeoliella mucimassa]